MMPRRAVVLLSGGLDSATALAEAQAQGFEAHALTVDYGQRHVVELQAARRVAQARQVAQHLELTVDLRAIGGSSLTGPLAVGKDRNLDEMTHGIPMTYVPARNTILLSLALGWAETLGAFDLVVGVNCIDYSGYPDCRPAFLRAFEEVANLATRAGVEGAGRFRIHAPLLTWNKVEIIRRGLELGVDYSLTHSCYDPGASGRACGHCDACLLRATAFQALGMTDPAVARSAE